MTAFTIPITLELSQRELKMNRLADLALTVCQANLPCAPSPVSGSSKRNA